MKKNKLKLFVFKFIIVSLFILVFAFSLSSTINKRKMYNELKAKGDDYLEEIKSLELILQNYKNELEDINSLKYVEEYARETLKMVGPNEIYFQINYENE